LQILQNPDLLVARILKAKYFPHGSIMDANVGRRPSYAWQSIIFAKLVIDHGTIWRIGDGENVRVWKDCWIPYPTSFSVQTPINTTPAEARVSELIDQDNNVWNSTVVKDIFWEEEANLILNIPLCQLKPRDRRI
jgi:hypothetical protein